MNRTLAALRNISGAGMLFLSALLCGALILLPIKVARASVDCNANSVDDATDLAFHSSSDCNHNGVPDECDISAQGWVPGNIIEVALTRVDGGSGVLTPTGVADFNGDGKLDLWGVGERNSPIQPAFGESFDDLVFVYLNRGDNTFGDATIFVIGQFVPFSVSTFFTPAGVRDIDGDGLPDIFGISTTQLFSPGNRGSSIEFLRGKGDGTFDFVRGSVSGLDVGIYGTDTIRPTNIASSTSPDFAVLWNEHVYSLVHGTGFNYTATDLVDATGATDLVADTSGPLRRLIAFTDRAVPFPNGTTYLPGPRATIAGAPGGAFTRQDELVTITGSRYFSAPLGSGNEEPSLLAVREQLPGRQDGASGKTSLFIDRSDSRPVTLRVDADLSSNSGLPPLFLDFDGDGKQDIALLTNTGAQILLNRGSGRFDRLTLAAPPTLAAPRAFGDFNGDGRADILYSEQDTSKAAILLNASTPPYVPPTAVDSDVDGVPDVCERASPLDWDGDRIGDPTIVRNGYPLQWFVAPSSTAEPFGAPYSVLFGLPGDTLMAGDYDGDGRVEPSVVRISGTSLDWYSLDSTQTTQLVSFGLAGDLPLTGYFDSDRKRDRAVVRTVGNQLHWYIQPSTDPQHLIQFDWGLKGDLAFAADLDGDGMDEAIVGRNTAGQIRWYARSLDGSFTPTASWGLAGDTLLPPADTNGDGRADFLVARALGNRTKVFSRDTSPEGLVATDLGGAGNQVSAMNSSGLGVQELMSKDDFTELFLSRFLFVPPSGFTDSIFFAFPSDQLVGANGQAAPRAGVRGALSCSAILPAFDGPGGFSWLGATSGKSSFFVPPGLVSQIKSIGIYSSQGVAIDTMKLASKRSGQYVSKRLTSPQIVKATMNGNEGTVVRVVLKSGAVLCESLGFGGGNFD